jgi:hypothetical protein
MILGHYDLVAEVLEEITQCQLQAAVVFDEEIFFFCMDGSAQDLAARVCTRAPLR